MKGKTVVLASILAMTSSFCLADESDHPTFIFRSSNLQNATREEKM